ncbi:uncharacterized protein [Mycetomoellerius zeteki]|nr:PREDICTED: uncharacterized protein LOC108729171 [Trachymyrmex zeteki]
MQCAKADIQAIETAMMKLPLNQRLCVKTCFEAAKANGKHGVRYTTDWIYEYLLLRIKSKKVYNHLRRHNLMALPSADTLNNYMKTIKGCYGFQESTFRLLKEKMLKMELSDVRGALLLDEMKLSKAVAFNPSNLKVNGFTNLGQFTENNKKKKRGDHALVFMFQPFKGKWVQALGCFLSLGSASGTILNKLVTECIILVENTGFKIDVVSSDGASWNRNMWNKFGVTITQP